MDRYQILLGKKQKELYIAPPVPRPPDMIPNGYEIKKLCSQVNVDKFSTNQRFQIYDYNDAIKVSTDQATDLLMAMVGDLVEITSHKDPRTLTHEIRASLSLINKIK